MGPFILIALAILLILIVLSVCVYPFICARIAIAGKRYNGIVTALLLLITLAAYIFACTTLEHTLNDWCYSAYAGIVLTPVVLYICTGVEDPDNWLGSGEKVQHKKITIPLLTLIVSLLFAIEGVMRMTHSYSIHCLLRYGWPNPVGEGFGFYSEEFKYAGVLLFIISLLSVLFIGSSFFIFYKEYKRNLAAELEKKSRIVGEILNVTQRLKADNALMKTFDAHQINDVGAYYNIFCKTIRAALDSSDERMEYSLEYSSFNEISTCFKTLLLKKGNNSFYFYPMAVVIKKNNEVYKYIPIGSSVVSLKTEKKNLKRAIPGDVLPAQQTWLHSCIDGSRDLRYSYNPRIYIYEYGILCISEMTLHVYRMESAKDVVSAYNNLYSCINHINVIKQSGIKKYSLKEKVDISINTLENKEENKNVEQVDEVTIPDQHIAFNPPITLEDCLCDLIRKRGVDILKDKNLVNCLTSMYKEVDITEYKDVLKRMASESFLYQFIEAKKQNDFVFYNISNDFARKHKLSVQKSLFITQAFVKAIKKSSVSGDCP